MTEPVHEDDSMLEDLRNLLTNIRMARREVERRAKEIGVPPEIMQYSNGTYPYHELIAAQSSVIHSIIMLTDLRPKQQSAELLYRNALEMMRSYYREPEVDGGKP